MIQSKKLIAKVDRPAPETLERSGLYRFEKNERTTLFSESEFNEMMKTITPFDLVAYGELEPFYDAVCKWLNIKRENLLLTAGSDQGIKAVYETFIGEGDEVINYTPNYAMFSVYAKMFGAREIVKSYTNDLIIDIDDLIHSINSATKLIVISNPGHNGVCIPEKDILRVLDHTRNSGIIVLVDEAYVHFSKVDMLKYINTYKNLLIVRTMSKAFGIASVRIGFLLACKDLIDELYRVKPVHEIDGIAAKIGKFLVEHLSIMEKCVRDITEGKDVLNQRLGKLGMTLLPSDTNFVYFRLNNPIDPILVCSELQKKNIYIKSPINAAPFNTYLRTTVGDAEQMNHLCNCIEEILEKHSGK